MERSFIRQPKGLTRPPTYSHVVTVTDATLVLIAGQVAYDEAGQIVGKGDLAAQADQVWKNITAALAAAGASTADLVKVNTYVVGYRTEMRQMLADIRAKYLGGDEPPASTLVGVEALALPDLLIEVEAVAAVARRQDGSGRRP